MKCRAWWEPILFSSRGAELAWLCPFHGIHQMAPVLNGWPSGDGETIARRGGYRLERGE